MAQDAVFMLVSALDLEEVYTSLFDSLTEEPQKTEDEQKLLFSLLPKVLCRLSADKTGLLSKAIPTLAPFLIRVSFLFFLSVVFPVFLSHLLLLAPGVSTQEQPHSSDSRGIHHRDPALELGTGVPLRLRVAEPTTEKTG